MSGKWKVAHMRRRKKPRVYRKKRKPVEYEEAVVDEQIKIQDDGKGNFAI